MEFLQGQNSNQDVVNDSILPSLRTYSILLFRKTLSTLSNPQEADKFLSNIQQDYLEPYLLAPLANILDTSSSAFSTSNILSILTLLLTLYISLRILDYARRVIMFWVMLVVRLAFWATVVWLGIWIYNVGIEKAVQDAGWFWGVVQGFLEDFVVKANSESAAGRGGQYYGGAGNVGTRGYGGAGKTSGYWHDRNRRA
uniref:Pentatricopeptide repeat-containing protein, mitochondrial n=1 Tax=Talaromyces marneffei PM1 TaxID=1077442 RepID=A0A093VMC8_TALMA